MATTQRPGRRTRRIVVNVREDQGAILDQLAEERGMATMEFARDLLLSVATRLLLLSEKPPTDDGANGGRA